MTCTYVCTKIITFVVELQFHSLTIKYLYANPFLSLPNKSPCMSSPKFGNLLQDILLRNQVILLESNSFIMMLYTFSHHILQKLTQQCMLRPRPLLIFSCFQSLLSLKCLLSYNFIPDSKISSELGRLWLSIGISLIFFVYSHLSIFNLP